MEEEGLLKWGMEAQGPGCLGPSRRPPEIEAVSVICKALALGNAIR